MSLLDIETASPDSSHLHLEVSDRTLSIINSKYPGAPLNLKFPDDKQNISEGDHLSYISHDGTAPTIRIWSEGEDLLKITALDLPEDGTVYWYVSRSQFNRLLNEKPSVVIVAPFIPEGDRYIDEGLE